MNPLPHQLDLIQPSRARIRSLLGPILILTATQPFQCDPATSSDQSVSRPPFQDMFKRPFNPITRVPQFTDLKEKLLHSKIKKLPNWQKMQELSSWFAPNAVALSCLRSEEDCQFRKGSAQTLRNDFGRRLLEMGFLKYATFGANVVGILDLAET